MRLKIGNLTLSFSTVAGLICLATAASATEKGGSVWPVGAESVAMATAVPHKGQTSIYEYTVFYEANELADQHGAKVPIPDFKLRVFAVAGKVSHDWGVHFLGGELGGWIAVPNVYEQLHLPGEKFTKNAIGNVNIVPFTVFNHNGIYHWYYELQFETAGSGYDQAAGLNIGQHNMAMTPAAAFTVTPHRLIEEFSSRFDYVFNDVDHATHYRSGNEFFWHFDAREKLPRSKATVGPIGYFYKQTTGDTQSGAPVVTENADGSKDQGYRGRVLDLGAQATLPIGKRGGMAFKWDHDMLVQNKPRGNAFWFQLAVPFSYFHRSAKTAK